MDSTGAHFGDCSDVQSIEVAVIRLQNLSKKRFSLRNISLAKKRYRLVNRRHRCLTQCRFRFSDGLMLDGGIIII